MALCELCEQLIKSAESDAETSDTRRMERAGPVIRLLKITGVPVSCIDCGASWIRWACYTDDLKEKWEYKPRLTFPGQ